MKSAWLTGAPSYSSLKLMFLHCSITSISSFDVRFSTSILPFSVVIVIFLDDLVCIHFLAMDAMAIQAGDDVATMIVMSTSVPTALIESAVLIRLRIL